MAARVTNPMLPQSPQHDAREAPRPSLLQADHADVDISLLENSIVRQDRIDVVKSTREKVAPLFDIDSNSFGRSW
jgi:hypothetical protein